MNPTLGFCYDFRNDSGVDIPPFGLFLAREVVKRKADDRLFLKAQKPIAAEVEHLYRNGAIQVAPGGYGCALLADICEVAYDPKSGTPDVGEPWGIYGSVGLSDSEPRKMHPFKLAKGYGGFEVLQKPQDPEVERVLVRRMSSHKLQGVLAGNVLSPTNGWTTATSFDVTLYRSKRQNDTSTGGSIYLTDYEAASPAVTLYNVANRDTTFSRNSGTFVKVEWIAGEWSIYWSGC